MSIYRTIVLWSLLSKNLTGFGLEFYHNVFLNLVGYVIYSLYGLAEKRDIVYSSLKSFVPFLFQFFIVLYCHKKN